MSRASLLSRVVVVLMRPSGLVLMRESQGRPHLPQRDLAPHESPIEGAFRELKGALDLDCIRVLDQLNATANGSYYLLMLAEKSASVDGSASVGDHWHWISQDEAVACTHPDERAILCSAFRRFQLSL